MSDTATTVPFSCPTPRGGWQPPSLKLMQAELPAFRFEEIIGRGGMGAVYKATQLSLGRAVAIKVLPADLMEDAEAFFAERFEQESRLMAKFSHANIVSVFESGKTPGGLLYMVMEFVAGTDLAGVIRSGGKVAPMTAAEIASQVCQALECAHGHGIIHRDIKPGNILITRDGTAKVADFGLAKHFDGGQHGFTKSSVTVGTPDFLAPEAWNPGTPLDGRADLYSLGVVLYQMLTGEVPRGLWKMPSEIAGTAPQFDTIIDRAMQPDREARYATAAEFLADLEDVRAAMSTAAVSPPRRRRRVVVPGATAVAVLAALALWRPWAETVSSRGHLSTVVTSVAPDGPGSLFEALANAAQNPGSDTITFDAALSGKEIRIAAFDIFLDTANRGEALDPITIDASALPEGVMFTVPPAPINDSYLYIGVYHRVEFRGATFKSGRRDYGGVVSNRGKLTLRDCTFYDNSAAMSGGAVFNEGDLTLIRCTFRGNSCSSSGGAIFSRGQLRMTDCTLLENKVGTGGGAVVCEAGTAVLTRCTIYGNESGRQGGGLLINSGDVTLTHCTIAGNKVTGTGSSHGGGGICFADTVTLRMDACIVAGNAAASGRGADIQALAGQPLAVRCLIGDGTDAALASGADGNLIGGGGVPLEARLSPIGDHGGGLLTMPPLPGSPAIDAASGSAATVDQRGRGMVGIPDIGAAEWQPLAPGK